MYEKDNIRLRVLFHDWHGSADDYRLMVERMALVMDLRNVPEEDLTMILVGLPDELVAFILQLIKELPA